MSLAIKASRARAMGDPGLFSSIGRFVGGAVRTGLGIAGAVLPGPIGAGARIISGALGGRPPPQIIAPPRVGQIPLPLQQAQRLIGGRPTRAGLIERRLGGGPMMFGGGVGAPAQPVGPGVACPAGMRPNKTSYFLKSGQFIEAGTVCVKVRRRNPLNVRALDRSISRIESAKKATKRIGRVTIKKVCP